MKSESKTYKLINGLSPLTYTIRSRSSASRSLLWYDEANNVNRPLRYARNQKSPFEDEQDGNAILEPIMFEDGLLHVPKDNPVLQMFLHYHPDKGVIFDLVDTEKDAQKEIEDLNVEVDALIKAKSLTINEMESIARVVFNIDPDNLTSTELKRDILLYAKEAPAEFLEVMSDSTLSMQSTIHSFFSTGLLAFRKNKTEVFFNLKNNKSKMINIPFGQDPYDTVVRYFQSEEGRDKFVMLQKLAEDETSN
jgi:hypothetical protein